MMNVTALNPSLLYQYEINTTIGEIINNMMVEQWNSSIIFENYYRECQPLQCTYDVSTRNDAIKIVTTVFALLGGLITVLKFSVPAIMSFMQMLWTQATKSRSK
jgi:hypothetical protein